MSFLNANLKDWQMTSHKNMSFILEQILTRRVPEWNKRVLTFDDFYLICEKEKLAVVEDENLKCKGEYGIYKNKPYIALKKQLKEPMKLWVGLHELGHHILHYPVNHRFSRSTLRRMDREANFFAAVALMPRFLVNSKTFGEIVEEYNYPNEIVYIRKDICDAYPKI